MGVKIELFRMVLYLTFPVAMFWISNQPQYFEEYVIKRKDWGWPHQGLLGTFLLSVEASNGTGSPAG
uniref:Protein PET100 homolog, mitochondrial n=1 Tax=Pelusios castaneus TaxID=367368 RepID=A0A8C8SMZ5_9SAUR